MNKEQNSSEAQTWEIKPLWCLKKFMRSFVGTFIYLGLFLYKGLSWLFSNYPNQTWAVLFLFGAISHFIISGNAKKQRDVYSKENAALLDSIDRITMNKPMYTDLRNRVVFPKR